MLLNVWVFVQVGVMACESAGAASERIGVAAVPFTAARPMVPVGFALMVLAVNVPAGSLYVKSMLVESTSMAPTKSCTYSSMIAA